MLSGSYGGTTPVYREKKKRTERVLVVPRVSRDWWWSLRLAHKNIQSCIQCWTGCPWAGHVYLMWRCNTTSNLPWECRSRTHHYINTQKRAHTEKGLYTHYKYKPAAKHTKISSLCSLWPEGSESHRRRRPNKQASVVLTTRTTMSFISIAISLSQRATLRLDNYP